MKPWTKYGAHRGRDEQSIPPMFLIPCNDLTLDEAIKTLRDASRAAELAATVTTRIPDQSEGMERLVDAYSASTLARSHGWFYSQEHEPPDRWRETYDMTPLDILPACARRVLEHPNDLLLKPSSIRLVVGSLLALGWHPRHIAGLIRSKYERDLGWGKEWYTYDAATRADFYVRLFATRMALGTDDLSGLACRPAGSSRLFCRPAGSCRLYEYAGSLLYRRLYERLACRPFNRLFLPEEPR